MSILFLILLLLAAVCFAADAMGAVVPRVKLVPLGLMFWVLVPLIHVIQGL